jgi:hypothetical protein
MQKYPNFLVNYFPTVKVTFCGQKMGRATFLGNFSQTHLVALAEKTFLAKTTFSDSVRRIVLIPRSSCTQIAPVYFFE